jgi:putative transposase
MEYRKGSHTIFNLQYRLVWVTKYRYHVLTGEVKLRVREIIRQICMRHELYIQKVMLARTMCTYWYLHRPTAPFICE